MKKTREKQQPYNPLEGERADISINMLQDGSEEQISIIIVHKDRPEYLNICLQSIAIQSLNSNYEVIVVDNASEEKDAIDFLDDLEEQGEVKIIRNKENFWWSRAANIGAKAADKNSKYLVFLHSDVVILNANWLDLLINVSEHSNEGAGSGLVGLSMRSYYLDKQKMDFIEEWCMLVTRECWQDVGPFCEELPIIGASFLFTLGAIHANHKPQTIRNPIVHHYGIFGIDINDYEKLSEEAQLILPQQMRKLQSKAKHRKR